MNEICGTEKDERHLEYKMRVEVTDKDRVQRSGMCFQ